MQERLQAYIRQRGLMCAGERVGVAVSGGADSVALLRLLLELRAQLGVIVAVVHFNHLLRGEQSDKDEAFVRELAEQYGLEFFRAAGETRTYAAEHGCGIEAAARKLRYGFFWRLLSPQTVQKDAKEHLRLSICDCRLDRIATAHTMDDQAETVVMRFARGAGTRGLAGIHPAVIAENKRSLDFARNDNSQPERSVPQSGAIVRPLLEFRRAQLRHYLRRLAQAWREDPSNKDVAFARNRVRQEVMPKLRELNPAIEQVLSETAEIARAEEEYWSEVVRAALDNITTKDTKVHEGKQEVPRLGLTSSLGMTNQQSSLGMTKQQLSREMTNQQSSREMTNQQSSRETTKAGAVVDFAKLLLLPVALQRRVVRAFAEGQGVRLEFHHVEQVLEVAGGPLTRRERRVELPGEWDACLAGSSLRLERRSGKRERQDYEYELKVPGDVWVEQAAVRVRARVAEVGARMKLGELRVRNWRAGDRYRPAHSSSEKKVKELLQDRRVPAESRAGWPVVIEAATGQIVWVPGFDYPEGGEIVGEAGVVLEAEIKK